MMSTTMPSVVWMIGVYRSVVVPSVVLPKFDCKDIIFCVCLQQKFVAIDIRSF